VKWGCGLVLVDESCAGGVSFDPVVWSDRYDVGAGKNRVEGTRELSSTVSDQVSEPMTVAESHREVAGCLGGPSAGRVDASGFEDFPNGGRGDAEAESAVVFNVGGFVVDASAARCLA
jgi:hypothetical protein